MPIRDDLTAIPELRCLFVLSPLSPPHGRRPVRGDPGSDGRVDLRAAAPGYSYSGIAIALDFSKTEGRTKMVAVRLDLTFLGMSASLRAGCKYLIDGFLLSADLFLIVFVLLLNQHIG